MKIIPSIIWICLSLSEVKKKKIQALVFSNSWELCFWFVNLQIDLISSLLIHYSISLISEILYSIKKSFNFFFLIFPQSCTCMFLHFPLDTLFIRPLQLVPIQYPSQKAFGNYLQTI